MKWESRAVEILWVSSTLCPSVRRLCKQTTTELAPAWGAMSGHINSCMDIVIVTEEAIDAITMVALAWFAVNCDPASFSPRCEVEEILASKLALA